MELLSAFKALSDESRFKLVNLLLTHDLCVGALARHLQISEAAVSQHLKQLREAGLVKGEKRGYWTHYLVDKGKLEELAEGLRNLTELPPCPEGLCSRNLNQNDDCRKESKKMCACKCQHPDKLKGKTAQHPCAPKKAGKK